MQVVNGSGALFFTVGAFEYGEELIRVILSLREGNVQVYTLFTTPYTPHPTPYTLHPTPHTLHPTPYTPHPTPYTPHPTP